MTEGLELDVFWELNVRGRLAIRAVSKALDEASVGNLSTPLDVQSRYPGFTIFLCRPNDNYQRRIIATR
jgi:hypothetical protein